MNLLNIRTPSAEEFQGTIDKILNSAEYSHLKGGLRDLFDGLKEKLQQWFMKLLSGTFSNLESANVMSEKLSMMFMITGILAIVAIIIAIVVKVSKTFERKRRVKEILGEKIDDSTTPITLLNKAEGFKEQGDYRQAIRFDFIGLLLLMHERTLLYLDETKTNEEIFNYLRKNNVIFLKNFKELIEIFNASWYGHRLCTEETYDNWKENFNKVWNEVINYEEKH